MFTPNIKDTLRGIKKTIGRYLAIFGIVAIGVAFFTGVRSASPIMKYSVDKYYDESNMADIKVLSNSGLNKDEFKDIENIDQIYMTHTIDANITIDKDQRIFRISGLPIENLSDNNDEYIDRPVLLEGRMPAESGECVIEKDKIKNYNINLGDEIEVISGTNANILTYLKTNKFKVVGLVKSSNYLSYEKGPTTLGDGNLNGFMMINEDDFSLPFFNEALITVKNAKSLNSYDDEYFNLVDPIKKDIESLNDDYIVTNRNSIYSFKDYESAADRINAISKVFPLFFIIVAMLVCLTTMTRLVEEDRATIGVLKALGYNRLNICTKYIFYAASASILGSIVGNLVGSRLFPFVIYNAWGIMYSLPEIQYLPQLKLMILTFIVVVLITSAVTIYSSYSELIQKPANIMRPKPPKNGKRIMLEKISILWKRLSFNWKVTFRNIFRYKKRFFMTIVGIGGCTALLLAGAGIKDSIKGIVKYQFEDIFNYDISISTQNEEYANQVIDKYKEDNRVNKYILISQEKKDVYTDKDDKKSANILITEDVNQFKKIINLRTRIGHKKIQLTNDGAVISEKLAKDLNVKVGDRINYDKDIKIKISAICENYIGNYIYLTDDYYNKTIDGNINYSVIFLRCNDDKDIEELNNEIINVDGVLSSFSFESIKTRFNKMISSINYVIIVLIISAGALASVVLYNLSNVNISERIREIATIKVLGFYNNEVSSYVFRENVILTFIGALVGLVLGVGLHSYIMNTIDLNDIMFGRNINTISFIFAVLITLFFGLLINVVMYFKLKKIPMVESLKTIE